MLELVGGFPVPSPRWPCFATRTASPPTLPSRCSSRWRTSARGRTGSGRAAASSSWPQRTSPLHPKHCSAGTASRTRPPGCRVLADVTPWSTCCSMSSVRIPPTSQHPVLLQQKDAPHRQARQQQCPLDELPHPPRQQEAPDETQPDREHPGRICRSAVSPLWLGRRMRHDSPPLLLPSRKALHQRLVGTRTRRRRRRCLGAVTAAYPHITAPTTVKTLIAMNSSTCTAGLRLLPPSCRRASSGIAWPPVIPPLYWPAAQPSLGPPTRATSPRTGDIPSPRRRSASCPV